MLAAGILITFLSNEIVAYLNLAPNSFLLIQIIGALYFAFGMLNWFVKANLIGGIYGRPISVANFTHFSMVALSLFKSGFYENIMQITITTVYCILAFLFGYIFMTHPKVN